MIFRSLRIVAACFAFAVMPAQAAEKQISADQYQQVFKQLCEQVAASHPDGERLNCAQAEKKFGSALNSAEQVREALRNAFRDAGIDNSKVMTPSEAVAHDLHVRSSEIGVGLSYSEMPLLTTGFTVSKVLDDSTAQEAGLRKGDLIVQVDGKSFRNLSQHAGLSILQGTPGSFAQLSIVRESKTQTISVKRDIDEKLGVELTANLRNAFVIQWAQDNGPAQLAGLAVEDIILSIGVLSTDQMSHQDAHRALTRGAAGSSVTISVLRAGAQLDFTVRREPLVDFSKTLDIRGQMGGQDDWYKLKLENLDWVGLPSFIDEFKEELQKHKDLIIDLRGTGGNDPVVAARLAARFMESGFVLGTMNGSGMQSSYLVDGGNVVRVDSEAKQRLDEPGLVERHNNRVTILVDSQTSGTAEAFASAMQKSGRARVIGIRSSGKSAIVGTFQASVGDEQIVVQASAGQLTNADGSVMAPVLPDLKSWDSSEIGDQALNELRGGGLWYSPTAFFYHAVGGSMVFGLLFLAYCFLVRSKTDEAQEATEDASSTQEDGAEVELETPVAQEQDEVEKNTPAEKLTAGRMVLAIGICTVLPIALLAFIGQTVKYKQSSKAVRGEIIVKTYVDGSDLSKLQEEIIRDLSSQYSGSITFSTVDVQKDPSAAGDVKNFPTVEIGAFYYAADGKVVSSQRGWFGPVPKREFPRWLEMYTKPTQSRDGIPVTRTATSR